MWMDTYFSKESLLYSGLESENREVFFFLALLFASVLHRYNLLITPCRKGNCRNFSRREARERKRERRRRRKKKKKGGEKKRKRRSRGVLSTFWEIGNAIVGCRSRKNDRRNPMRAPRHLNRSDSVPVQLFSCSLFSRYHPSLILAVCHFLRRSFFSLPSFDRRVNLLIIPRSWPPLSNQDVNWISSVGKFGFNVARFAEWLGIYVRRAIWKLSSLDSTSVSSRLIRMQEYFLAK